MEEAERQDDSVEGGALDDPGEGGRIPGEQQEEPAEGGSLEEDEERTGERRTGE